MIAPFWLKPRIGPYLRRERDKRDYFKLFVAGAAITGWRRLSLLASKRQYPVGTAWPQIDQVAPDTIVVFDNALADNEKKSFAQVRGHGPFLRRELLAISRPRYHPEPTFEPFVAIHVRLGDFRAPASGDAGGDNNTRLPIDWYADRLSALRTTLGRELPARVFSDGSDTDLGVLLDVPGVKRAPRASAVTDILAIGQGVCVIASASGFSLWGAFLGSAPRIAFPGGRIVPIYDDPACDVESNFDEPLPTAFIDAVATRISARHP